MTTTAWPSRRLKNVVDVVFSSVDKKSVEGQIRVRLCNYTDVYRNDEISADLALMEATASVDQMRSFGLQAGDVLITKDSETADDIGVAAFVPQTLDGVVCGYHLAVLRPERDRVDPKYLFWSMASAYARDQMTILASGVTRFGLRFGDVVNLLLFVPELDRQRAVARFLDRETARIDVVIMQSRKLLALIHNRERLLLGHVLSRRGAFLHRTLDLEQSQLPVGWHIIRLSRLLAQLTNGYVGPTRDILLEQGVKYIQSVHIKDGGIDFARRPYFVGREWHLENRRTALRSGDLLIVQTGDVGQVALVPDGFGEANCHALLIARVRIDKARPQYLFEYFRSNFGFESLLRETTGALHPHLEAGKVRDINVVVPPLQVQDELLAEVMERRAKSALIVKRIEQQLGLLSERRQTLITAAITGQIDVAGDAA